MRSSTVRWDRMYIFSSCEVEVSQAVGECHLQILQLYACCLQMCSFQLQMQRLAEALT